MKKRQQKKGQVSLEFLTTYGWAFLVALIAIGALAYFGVLNPSKYTPKRCNFGSEVNCNDFRLSLDASNRPIINFRLTNNIGTSVKISLINVTNKAATPLAGCSMLAGGVALPATYDWNDGAIVDFTANTCTAGSGGFIKGDKNKVNVVVEYYDPVSGATYKHVVNGELYDQVQ